MTRPGVPHDLVFNLRDLGGAPAPPTVGPPGGDGCTGATGCTGSALTTAPPSAGHGAGPPHRARDRRAGPPRRRRHRLAPPPRAAGDLDPSWATPAVAAERFLADRYLTMLAEGRRRWGGPVRARRPGRLPAASLRRRQGPHGCARGPRAGARRGRRRHHRRRLRARAPRHGQGASSSGCGSPTRSGSTPWPTSPRRSSRRPTTPCTSSSPTCASCTARWRPTPRRSAAGPRHRRSPRQPRAVDPGR